VRNPNAIIAAPYILVRKIPAAEGGRISFAVANARNCISAEALCLLQRHPQS
jgi:hypothetical protein